MIGIIVCVGTSSMLITFHKYALFVGIIAIALMHYFYTDPTSLPHRTTSVTESVPPCALSTTPCQQGDASITLDKDVIRPMEKARIVVEWPALSEDIEQLALSLEGEEMMMGVYRMQLTREAGTSYFSGELMLPFCTSDAMTWVGSTHPITDDPQAPHRNRLSLSIRMIK